MYIKDIYYILAFTVHHTNSIVNLLCTIYTVNKKSVCTYTLYLYIKKNAFKSRLNSNS